MNEFNSSLTCPSVKPDFYLKMNIKLLQSNQALFNTIMYDL